MSCDCVEKLQQKLREATGDPGARVAFAFVFSVNGVDGHVQIPVVRREGGAGGLFSGYCPICGKEIV
jgi:hypothetical protein